MKTSDITSAEKPILYNFVKYDVPRKAIYEQDTNKYKNGWVQKEVETTVIGEAKQTYVERLLESSSGEWVGDKVVTKEFILPLGFHKSRLVRWVDAPAVPAVMHQINNPEASAKSPLLKSENIFEDGYMGGKGKPAVAQTIINIFPEHTIYYEMFLGAGSVFRKKKECAVQMGFDIDPDVIAQWKKYYPKEATNIHCADAFDKLTDPYVFNYNDPKQVLIFLDPPYPLETRSSKRRYKNELTDEQHVKLLEWAVNAKYNIVISTYPNDLYASMLKDWNRTEYFSTDRRSNKRLEHLYFNFEKPTVLHQYTHIGNNYRERENIKRQITRWKNKFSKMSPLLQNAILNELNNTK